MSTFSVLRGAQVDELTHDIANTAANAVDMCLSRDGTRLDYSQASLAVVEDVLTGLCLCR